MDYSETGGPMSLIEVLLFIIALPVIFGAFVLMLESSDRKAAYRLAVKRESEARAAFDAKHNPPITECLTGLARPVASGYACICLDRVPVRADIGSPLARGYPYKGTDTEARLDTDNHGRGRRT
jgi:hypothetical protein